jgi:GNAT superfamily N-acetyltransferase
MPDEFKIRELAAGDDLELLMVEKLFQAMYEYMGKHGLIIGLAADGANAWIKGAKKGLGRFGVIFIASLGDDIIGFAHGSIRLTPDYLGNRKVGVITHIFVEGANRNKGIGEKLVRKLEDWFKKQEVDSVELQVLSANQTGIRFWEWLGYHSELLQCRKPGSKL